MADLETRVAGLEHDVAKVLRQLKALFQLVRRTTGETPLLGDTRPPTAEERRQVAQIRHAWVGRCLHDTECDDRVACEARILDTLRRKAG